MIIDDSVFRDVVGKLHNSGVNPVHWKYDALFIKEGNVEIPVHNVEALVKISLYFTETTSYYIVTVNLFRSAYQELLKNNRKVLKFQLTRTPTTLSGEPVSTGGNYVETYVAHLLDLTSEAIKTNIGGLTGTYLDDLGGLVTIRVQLQERGMAEFRLWEIGGVYRNVTMQNLILGLMSTPIKALGESNEIGYSVSMVKADNDEIYYQRLIPNGISLPNLPGYLQKIWGVYSGGIGNFLHNGMWYIFPMYNFKRYQNTKKRVTIINVPRNEMMGLTTSYHIEGDEIYLYATGDTKHIDTADKRLDKSGTGFKAANLGNLVNGFTESAGGLTYIPKGKNFNVVSFDERNSEVDNIKAVPNLMTDNLWRESAEVIQNMGNFIKLSWENSNPNILYPGIPVRFIYKYRGVPYALFGTVAAIDTKTTTTVNNVTDTAYVNNSNLTIHCERATQ